MDLSPLRRTSWHAAAKNISEGNLQRIRRHAQSAVSEIRILAELVLEIARVHPRRRHRVTSIAANHWPLFVRMVEILGDRWWDSQFSYSSYEGGPSWLEEQWRQAASEIWSSTHGVKPCRCGSGRTYRDCCAERDDVFTTQFLQEQSERSNEFDPDSIPWWHPESTIDHFTRCGYETYYTLGEDHPFALVPPECRGIETAWACRKKTHRTK